MPGNFSLLELFIIGIIAIVVVGPKDLPKVVRSVMGMVRKVREMGREFQQGVKKMADEVELDAVTRQLNEAGNVKLDDTKPKVDPSAEFSDYDEFDYDQYDYEGGDYTPPPKKDETDDENVVEEKTAADLTPEPPDIVEDTEPAQEELFEDGSDKKEDVKSKTDG